jgi:hypothetical protein
MTPIIVVLGSDDLAPAVELCQALSTLPGVVLVVDRDGADGATTAAACTTLAAAGLSTVVLGRPARADALARELGRSLPRVLATGPSVPAALTQLRARGWLDGDGPDRDAGGDAIGDDVYTDEELERVTARLRDLGYA